MTKATINFKGKTVTQQGFADEGVPASVVICVNNKGNRYAKISYYGAMTRKGTVGIPVEMLSLAAGKDAWMRNIEFKCRDCRATFPAHQMECELCPACYDKAGQEIEALDNKLSVAS